MDKATCFKIGYIAKAHGLKGEVTLVVTETLDLTLIKSVFVETKNNLVPYFIDAVSDRGDKAFVKFEDVNSVEQANVLKGCSIYLNKDLRPKLKRGEFYDDEVINFSVEDENGEPLGVVKEVIHSGANRLLALIYLGKEVLIPVNGPFIVSVNKAKKKIIVQLPDGFLDI
jgi:16S rRNA processing protein RimM